MRSKEVEEINELMDIDCNAMQTEFGSKHMAHFEAVVFLFLLPMRDTCILLLFEAQGFL